MADAPEQTEGTAWLPTLAVAKAWQAVVTELPPGASSQKVLEEIEDLTNPKIKLGKKSLSPDQLMLKQTVLANFEQKRLDEVLHELAEQTGVSIQLDSRAKDKQALPVTALFRNDTSLRDVLTILANMADLQVVELSTSVYITTPANAEMLRKAKPQQPSPSANASAR